MKEKNAYSSWIFQMELSCCHLFETTRITRKTEETYKLSPTCSIMPLTQITVSQNHRITYGTKDLKDHHIQPPTWPTKFHHQAMSLSATSTHFRDTFRDGDSTTPLGSPFQCLTVLPVKKFLLITHLNPPAAISLSFSPSHHSEYFTFLKISLAKWKSKRTLNNGVKLCLTLSPLSKKLFS